MARWWAASCSIVITLALAGCEGHRDAHPAPAAGSAASSPGSAAPPPGADPLAAIAWNDAPLDWSLPIGHATRDLSGYAGSAACTACHEPIAKTYARHSMARTGMRAIASLPAADTAMLAKIFDAG